MTHYKFKIYYQRNSLVSNKFLDKSFRLETNISRSALWTLVSKSLFRRFKKCSQNCKKYSARTILTVLPKCY